jgi:hypothetical protein
MMTTPQCDATEILTHCCVCHDATSLQPGLIKVGELIPPERPDESIPPMNPNPRCSCCPEPPPQRFSFAKLPIIKRKVVAEGLAAGDAAAAEAAAASGYLSYAEAWAWFNENMA